ncbi:protein MAIN-LIKE 1-like [Punica granatum]|uniref:Uncharacterized protein n=2 Tax=Punica granatum TaxID=22663 RepID=A0A2I0I215_PUNGR|nr:protein MAIN-LIKE 1-like [Punica granatum]PKI37997.1 hypothetical protein CRG98_041593 [Punica granatum]
MKKTGRKSSIAFSEVRSSIESYSTKFSSPKFVKRVEALTDEQRIAIEKTGFGNLLLIPNQTMNRKLLLELMDRWSFERRAFELAQGELTVTLLDVALIMGLRVNGNPVLLREDEPFSDLERQYGATPDKRKISVDFIESRLESLGEAASDDFIRTFLLFTFGIFLFPDTSGNVDSRYLSFLESLDDVCGYAWGSAVLEEILMWLNKRKDSNTQSVGGCLTFLQIWSYEHIDLARPGLLDKTAFPRACRWENRKHHPRPSISITTMFHDLKDDQMIWMLKPTSYELELDVVKELMEVQNDGNELSGGLELSPTSPGIVKSEIVSDTYSPNDAPKGEERKELLQPCPCELQNRSDPSTDLEYPTVSSSPRSANVELPSTSQDTSMILPAGDEDTLILKNQKLEDRVLELEKEIDGLKLRLKEQQRSDQILKEENAELKKEVDDLRRDNRAISLSSDDLVCRLENLLSGDGIDDGEGT